MLKLNRFFRKTLQVSRLYRRNVYIGSTLTPFPFSHKVDFQTRFSCNVFNDPDSFQSSERIIQRYYSLDTSNFDKKEDKKDEKKKKKGFISRAFFSVFGLAFVGVVALYVYEKKFQEEEGYVEKYSKQLKQNIMGLFDKNEGGGFVEKYTKKVKQLFKKSEASEDPEVSEKVVGEITEVSEEEVKEPEKAEKEIQVEEEVERSKIDTATIEKISEKIMYFLHKLYKYRDQIPELTNLQYVEEKLGSLLQSEDDEEIRKSVYEIMKVLSKTAEDTFNVLNEKKKNVEGDLNNKSVLHEKVRDEINNYVEFKENEKEEFLKLVEETFMSAKCVILDEWDNIITKNWNTNAVLKEGTKVEYIEKRKNDLLEKIDKYYSTEFVDLIRNNLHLLDTKNMKIYQLSGLNRIYVSGALKNFFFDSFSSIFKGLLTCGLCYGASLFSIRLIDALENDKDYYNTLVNDFPNEIKNFFTKKVDPNSSEVIGKINAYTVPVSISIGGMTSSLNFLKRKYYRNYYFDKEIVDQIKNWFVKETASVRNFRSAFEKMFIDKLEQSYDERLDKESKLRLEKEKTEKRLNQMNDVLVNFKDFVDQTKSFEEKLDEMFPRNSGEE